MLKSFPSGKMNNTKNVLFFLSQAPAHHSYTFNLRFLYEMKHKVSLSKIEWNFHFFDSALFLLKIIFLLNKMYGLFHFKTP